jgi:hypothetical protein
MNLNENRVTLFASLLEMLVVAYPLLEERLKEGKTFDFAEFIRVVAALTETETFPPATTFPPIPPNERDVWERLPIPIPLNPYTPLPSINPTFPTETVPPIPYTPLSSPPVFRDGICSPAMYLYTPLATHSDSTDIASDHTALSPNRGCYKQPL